MCVCIKVHRYKVDAVTLRNGTHAYHVSRTSSLLFLPFFLFDSFFFNYYFGKIFLLLVPHVCARFSFRFLPEKFLTRRVCERLYVKQQFLWIRNTEKNNNNNRPAHTHTHTDTHRHTLGPSSSFRLCLGLPPFVFRCLLTDIIFDLWTGLVIISTSVLSWLCLDLKPDTTPYRINFLDQYKYSKTK